MNINKWIYAKNSYMTKMTDICNDIKLDMPEQTIPKAYVQHFVKIVQNYKVTQLTDFMIVSKMLGSKIHTSEPLKAQTKNACFTL